MCGVLEGEAMTESDRKLLTEWLGEEWHEWEWFDATSIGSEESDYQCKKCKKWQSDIGDNRTFTTWADFGAVWERLVKSEQEVVFLNYVHNSNWKNRYFFLINPNNFTWLLSTDDGTFRLCDLIVEALKEGVI